MNLNDYETLSIICGFIAVLIVGFAAFFLQPNTPQFLTGTGNSTYSNPGFSGGTFNQT